jgi:ABC-type methionine transport system ATPase subunit
MRKMVELTIPREYKDEPIFYQMITWFKVIPTIIEASFSSDTGWAYVKLEGEEEELDRVIDFLKSRNIIVDFRA